MPLIIIHSTSLSPSCLQEQLTDREVKNFTKDWNDGTTIAALVDALAPGLCPEYAIMNPETALENATHAMKLAEEWLGVPMVSLIFPCHFPDLCAYTKST